MHGRPFKFPEESLEMLNEADRSIDHLIPAHALEPVRRDALAFREIHRVLEPGGDVALPVPYAYETTTGAVRFEPEWLR